MCGQDAVTVAFQEAHCGHWVERTLGGSMDVGRLLTIAEA